MPPKRPWIVHQMIFSRTDGVAKVNETVEPAGPPPDLTTDAITTTKGKTKGKSTTKGKTKNKTKGESKAETKALPASDLTIDAYYGKFQDAFCAVFASAEQFAGGVNGLLGQAPPEASLTSTMTPAWAQ